MLWYGHWTWVQRKIRTLAFVLTEFAHKRRFLDKPKERIPRSMITVLWLLSSSMQSLAGSFFVAPSHHRAITSFFFFKMISPVVFPCSIELLCNSSVFLPNTISSSHDLRCAVHWYGSLWPSWVAQSMCFYAHILLRALMKPWWTFLYKINARVFLHQ